MLLIGLTGGIASGKSRVSALFERFGACIVDADLLAREVVQPGSEGLAELVAAFSRAVLAADGTLDRAALRQQIFADPAARQRVDAILHPRIRALSEQRIDEARSTGCDYTIYVVPLLVETGQQARFDRIAVVDVPESVQLARLMARDGGSEADARRILASQASRDERLAVADDIIDNSGSIDHLTTQVHELHHFYRDLVRPA